ncbi:MAG: acyl-ACP desaturase [Acidimicrobiia bacterium]|nr:acyl-ACP desaturase [Acidimicrobiia bacterium]
MSTEPALSLQPIQPHASSGGLVAALEGAAERLLERHIETAPEWFPHELVPWHRAADLDPSEPWCSEDSSVRPEARVALLVNLLTEDNLPYYFNALHAVSGDGPLAEWTRRWTAEEGRHSIVIRDYLTVTRAIDPIELERGRMQQVSHGVAPQFDTLADALVYATLQELATRISHRSTGKLLDDPAGVAVMNRVAADENLHHLFYRDLVAAAIEVAPSEMVRSIDHVVSGFAMPGTGITDFAKHARVMAEAQVYDFALHHDQVVAPIVLGRWKLEDIVGLDSEAEAARDRVLRHIRRLRKAADRLKARRTRSRAVAEADRREFQVAVRNGR